MKIKNNLHIAVILNGEFVCHKKLLAELDKADKIIAADGGANWLFSHGRKADMLIGDMDSVAPDILENLLNENCQILRYPSRKDKTDAELALEEAVKMGAAQIIMMGALGKRLDHSMANLFLLLMPKFSGLSIRIFDGKSYTSLISSELLIKGKSGDLLSLIPFGRDAHGISAQGLEYSLKNESLFLGSSRGISNVLIQSEARITLKEGRLLVIHTPNF